MSVELDTSRRSMLDCPASESALAEHNLPKAVTDTFRFVSRERLVFRYMDGHRKKWKKPIAALWEAYSSGSDEVKCQIAAGTRQLTQYQQTVLLEMLYVVEVAPRIHDSHDNEVLDTFAGYMQQMWSGSDGAEERKEQWYHSFRQTTAIPEHIRNYIFDVDKSVKPTELDAHAQRRDE